MVRRYITITVGILLVGGFLLRRIRCQQRGAAFARQIETLKHDAREELKVGADKVAVARFFADHNIPYTVSTAGTTEAIGTLSTTGCAPMLACGTDSAIVGVRVKVNAEGVVNGEAKVFDLYTDCF